MITVIHLVLGTILLTFITTMIYLIRDYRRVSNNALLIANEAAIERVMDDWTLLTRGTTGSVELEDAYLKMARKAYHQFSDEPDEYLIAANKMDYFDLSQGLDFYIKQANYALMAAIKISKAACEKVPVSDNELLDS